MQLKKHGKVYIYELKTVIFELLPSHDELKLKNISRTLTLKQVKKKYKKKDISQEALYFKERFQEDFKSLSTFDHSTVVRNIILI
jgi:hypothetical protein